MAKAPRQVRSAPAARTPTTVDAGDDASNRDLWNAIDEGHDPTR